MKVLGSPNFSFVLPVKFWYPGFKQLLLTPISGFVNIWNFLCFFSILKTVHILKFLELKQGCPVGPLFQLLNLSNRGWYRNFFTVNLFVSSKFYFDLNNFVCWNTKRFEPNCQIYFILLHVLAKYFLERLNLQTFLTFLL